MHQAREAGTDDWSHRVRFRTWSRQLPTVHEAVEVPFKPKRGGLAFHEGGKQVAIHSDDTSIPNRVWNLAENLVEAPDRTAHWQSRHRDALAANGNTIVHLGGSDYQIVDTDNTTVHTFQAQGPTPPRLFAGGGSVLYQKSKKELVWRTLGIQGKDRIIEFNIDNGGVRTFAGSPNGSTFVVAGIHQMHLWRTAKMDKPAYEIRAFETEVLDVAYSPDSSMVLSGSGGALKLWSALDGNALFEMPVESEVCGVAFSPLGRFFAASQSNGLVRFWSVPDAVGQIGLPSPKANNFRVAISPDGSLVAPVGIWFEQGQDTVRAYHLHDNARAGTAIRPGGWVHAGQFDPNNRELVLATSAPESTIKAVRPNAKTLAEPGRIQWFDAESGRATSDAIGTSSAIFDLAFSPDGKQLIALSGDGHLLMIDAAQRTVMHSLSLGAPIFMSIQPVVHERIVYHPDGTRFAVLLNEPFVRLISAKTGEVLHRYACKSFASDLAFSPDGHNLAIGDGEKASVWQIGEATSPLQSTETGERVVAVDFSPDGKRLALVGEDQAARLWDWKRDSLVCPAMPHPDDVLDVKFLPSGRAILTVCRNPVRFRGRLRIWEAKTGSLMAPPLPDDGLLTPWSRSLA